MAERATILAHRQNVESVIGGLRTKPSLIATDDLACVQADVCAAIKRARRKETQALSGRLPELQVRADQKIQVSMVAVVAPSDAPDAFL